CPRSEGNYPLPVQGVLGLPESPRCEPFFEGAFIPVPNSTKLRLRRKGFIKSWLCERWSCFCITTIMIACFRNRGPPTAPKLRFRQPTTDSSDRAKRDYSTGGGSIGMPSQT